MPQQLDFDAFTNSLKAAFSARLDKKDIQLTIHNPSGVKHFQATEAYLKRIFHNLLDNAFKYTQRGEIRIGVEPRDQELVFWVADTGVGIPPQDRERVFERFYRVDASRELAGGSGIGLSIVRHIVELQGGRIWLESELNQGTKVFFTLPT